GRSVAIATVIGGEGVGSRALVTETDLECGGHAAALLSDEVRAAARPPHSRSKTITVGSSEIYIEVLRPPATLVVFGGSAVAIPLLSFAKTLGFRTIVIDGRERFATRERFPDADQIRVGIASEIAGQIQLGPTTPIVLVAHDYKIDVPVLKRALSTDAPYIGLLGSRRRGAAILQMLRDDGVAETLLARIRTPIGLDLGGETAAEIALSIVSEVVAVMHGRSGSALTTKHREAVLQAT
ncbi:MAG: XdhC family protein, partial [Thermoanaerobaculia bacterium]